MNTLNQCPCCSEPLLRHARHGRVYWFCRHCHQEMPNLMTVIAGSDRTLVSSKENFNNLLNMV